MPVSATLVSEQTMQVGVSGPGDVTAMHVVSGIASVDLRALTPIEGGNQERQATFAAHVGPTLTAAQFRKAIANVAISSPHCGVPATLHFGR
jgi:hypothetical protein